MNDDPETYVRHRHRLSGLLGPDAVAVIPGARAQRRNGDNDHPFRQDSDFLYLCGFNEPQPADCLRGVRSPIARPARLPAPARAGA